MRAHLAWGHQQGRHMATPGPSPMPPCLSGVEQVSAGPRHLPRRLLPGGRLGGAMRAATATRRSMYILVPTMTPVSSSTAPISTRSAAPACARRPVSARPAAAEAHGRGAALADLVSLQLGQRRSCLQAWHALRTLANTTCQGAGLCRGEARDQAHGYSCSAARTQTRSRRPLPHGGKSGGQRRGGARLRHGRGHVLDEAAGDDQRDVGRDDHERVDGARVLHRAHLVRQRPEQQADDDGAPQLGHAEEQRVRPVLHQQQVFGVRCRRVPRSARSAESLGRCCACARTPDARLTVRQRQGRRSAGVRAHSRLLR